MKLLKKQRAIILLQGAVQGMGFRPFVHRLASSLKVAGSVRNSVEGLIIEIEGEEEKVEEFIIRLLSSPPPFALLEKVEVLRLPPLGYEGFQIQRSEEGRTGLLFPLPDIATCRECLQETLTPGERRYFYPFTNCTNCGPRFSIIRALPYDRERTSMRKFKMCPDCQREYDDIRDRRYHAQPIACPACGPHIWLEVEGRRIYGDALKEAVNLLLEGKILAIKGLGGFHLACNALDEEAVRKLRERKRRPFKPFAIMVRDLEMAHCLAELSPREEELLSSPQAPILLLPKKGDLPLAPSVAPNNKYLGIFLPYTPLHHLLMRECDAPLVMTSGNRTDEPLSASHREAKENLRGIADAFLLHNRDIVARCDDSVARVVRGRMVMIRRARGYVPLPLRLPYGGEDLLACGADLKNVFALCKGNWAFLSQHIGDLENATTFSFYKKVLKHLSRLLNIKPKLVAYDLHPTYHSTRFALSLGLPSIGVQHHHAHIASCMVENDLPREEVVLGVALDGTGYGLDGKIWGGEILLTTYQGFTRLAHLRYIPLIGGEMAIKQPWRIALAYLSLAEREDLLEREGLELPAFLRRWGEEKVKVLRRMMEKGINSPLASSMGRLFDAVSALLGVRFEATYEGQPAVELENISQECEEHYPFQLEGEEPLIMDVLPLIRGIVDDLLEGRRKEEIASKFHRSIVEMLASALCILRKRTGVRLVALSGGVFQNALLLKMLWERLEGEGFSVLIHGKVPPNDGGIALGQAVIARSRLEG